MSKIKMLKINNFLGVDELGLKASKINIIKGPKGSGKSSILEAIEKTLTNRNRRTEVVKHGTDEATLYVELDDGLEINRKIRTEKSDYFKLRKGNEGVQSTEKFLRSLINGDIFRPIDWINMSIKEQTKSILNMLQIKWTKDDILAWFGEEPSNIDYEQHILQILKSIELKYYADREQVNREIRELKTQIKVIVDELPADYDGEVWRAKSIQEYYNKVSEAQKINSWIEKTKMLQEGFENKIKAIKATGESETAKINLKYKDQRQDISDIIELSKAKIEKAKSTLLNIDSKLSQSLKEIDLETEKQIQKTVQKIKTEAEKNKEAAKKAIELEKEEAKDLISINESKIAAKKQELISTDSLEKQEVKAVGEKILSEIEKEKVTIGKAADYLKNHETIDIEPLQQEADEVTEMQSYLRQWDKMLEIRDNKLSEKQRYSSVLTERIDKARTLPGELLKTAKMPIGGISVDSNGFIRINNTLIDGLSDGEKLELAMKIAKAQVGDLKIICLDRFESLNPAEQQKLFHEIENDDFQYFISSTNSDEFQIEKLG